MKESKRIYYYLVTEVVAIKQLKQILSENQIYYLKARETANDCATWRQLVAGCSVWNLKWEELSLH